MRRAIPAVFVLLAACGEAQTDQQNATEAKAEAAVAAGFKPGGPAPIATVAVDPMAAVSGFSASRAMVTGHSRMLPTSPTAIEAR